MAQIGLLSTMNEIFSWFHAERIVVSETIDNLSIEEQIDVILRPSGIRKRIVQLTGAWYKDSTGPLLAEMREKLIALIPGSLGGYYYKEPDSGKKIKINKRNAGQIEEFAYVLYPALPKQEITARHILQFIFHSIPKTSYVLYLLIIFTITVIGLLTPAVNKIFFAVVIPAKNETLLMSTMALLFGMSLLLFLIALSRDLILSRVSAYMKLNIEAAVMSRILELPLSVFKNFTDGELADRVSSASYLCGIIFEYFVPKGITALFSIVYVFQIILYAPSLLVFVLGFILLNFGLSIAAINTYSNILAQRIQKNASINGFIFELFNGIEKIKSFGAEKRAFEQWEKHYAPVAKLYFRPPFIIKCYPAIQSLIAAAGIIVHFWIAAKFKIEVADFISFNIAFGMVCGAFLSISGNIEFPASIKPLLNFLMPIMKEKQENSDDKEIVSHLGGDIELRDLTFFYPKTNTPVFKNFSLRIGKGQYVAVVGKTGSGKTSLFRLLLGFEKPQTGSILYDSKYMENLDLKSLRRKIGAVLQTSILMQGTVFENIAQNAPGLRIDEAWEAAEIAGIADDIRMMPMGMHTLIAEGGGGFSGGQRQRILIARAVASHPHVLLFDEAFSALDNITQRNVENALAGLNVTRLVIAHRLSTVRHCDRIIVLDGGRIVEDGVYDDLLQKNGVFAELVTCQH